MYRTGGSKDRHGVRTEDTVGTGTLSGRLLSVESLFPYTSLDHNKSDIDRYRLFANNATSPGCAPHLAKSTAVGKYTPPVSEYI